MHIPERDMTMESRVDIFITNGVPKCVCGYKNRKLS